MTEQIWILMCSASVVFLLSLGFWSRKVRSGSILRGNAIKIFEQRWEKAGVQMAYDDGEFALGQFDGYKILPGYETRRDAAITAEKQTNEKLDAANERMRAEEEQEFMWIQTRVLNRKSAEAEWKKKQEERKTYKEKAESNLEAAKKGDEISPASKSADNSPTDNSPSSNDSNGGKDPH